MDFLPRSNKENSLYLIFLVRKNTPVYKYKCSMNFNTFTVHTAAVQAVYVKKKHFFSPKPWSPCKYNKKEGYKKGMTQSGWCKAIYWEHKFLRSNEKNLLDPTKTSRISCHKEEFISSTSHLTELLATSSLFNLEWKIWPCITSLFGITLSRKVDFQTEVNIRAHSNQATSINNEFCLLY